LEQKLIRYRCCSVFCASCWGHALQKSLRLRRFKLDWDEILQDCSSSKYELIDELDL